MTEPSRLGGITPAQTVGPFFHYALSPNGHYPLPDLATPALVAPDAAGTRIRFEGSIVDGNGEAVTDALVEIWQADGDGRYPDGRAGDNTGFTGFGRCACDGTGHFSFETVKPGRVAGPAGLQAPHLNLGVFGRGLLHRLHTRVYFADEPSNAQDPILALVPAERRDTLVATLQERPGQTVYRLDLRLQGEGETVFFLV